MSQDRSNFKGFQMFINISMFKSGSICVNTVFKQGVFAFEIQVKQHCILKQFY